MARKIIVVGAGNAAFSAAVAARKNGCDVLILERAPENESGGNSRFTAGAIRCVYDGVEDLLKLMPDLTESEIERTDFGSYTESDFYDDIGRVTDYRTDPELSELLVTRSRSTIQWMAELGIKFAPIWGRQAFLVDGRFKFWGGLTVEARALSLVYDDDGVKGVNARINGKTQELLAEAVVLASGGFQSNTEWRTKYLGQNWDLAKVRGSRFSTGDGLKMALDVGAMPYGNWSGCHAVGWDRNAPEFGDLSVGDNFFKNTVILSALCSTPMANASLMKVLILGTIPTRNTVVKYSPNLAYLRGKYLIIK